MTEPGFGWAALTREVEETIVGALTLRPLTLPREFGGREGAWKGERVAIETRAYTGDTVELARFAVVRGGGMEIGNILCLPRTDYPFPILGADLVAIRADAGMLAADLSPTLPTGEERERQFSSLAAVPDGHPALPPGGELPPWCAEWFSPHPIFTRGTKEALRAAPDVLRDLVSVFLSLAADPAPRPECAAYVAGVLRGYCAAHRTDDKGLNLLGKMFGPAWAAAYVEEILFPDLRSQALQEPDSAQ